MSPLDNELRQTLAQHAVDVADASDLLTQVEGRARAIHRRRIGAAGVGSTAVVAVIVAIGITLAGGGGTDRVAVPPASHTPSPPEPSGPTPVVMTWPMVGADPSWVRWDAVIRSAAPQMPTGFAPVGVPHVVGVGDTDAGAVAVFVVPAGDHLVAGAVLRSDPGTAVALHDIASDGDVPLVGVVVHVTTAGGQVDDGVVVGAPTTGQILFKLPGQAGFQPVEGSGDPRWATVTLGHVSPGDPVAQVQLLDGNGDTDKPIYSGPIQVGVTFPDV